MSVAALLEQLRRAAIVLSLDDGANLRIQGNKRALTPELLTQIKDNKAALVAHLQQGQSGTVAEPQYYRTSVGQHRFWLIDQMMPGATHYNLPVAFDVPMPFVPQAAQKAFEQIIERHEVLRTVFIKKDGMSWQKVLPRLDFKLALHDLAGHGDAQAEYDTLVSENAATCFDLAKGPLFQAAFVRRDANHGVMLINLHHIIADQWSMDILLNEFSLLYRANAMGGACPLSPLSMQYGDYANWQREQLEGADLVEQLAFWQSKLENLPVTHSLPLKGVRPVNQTFNGACRYLVLPSDKAARIRTVAARHKLSPFMLFNGLFAVLLARFSGVNDIVMGVPVNVRTQAAHQSLVGPFLNTYILRFDCDESLSVTEYFAKVREVNLSAMKNQLLPFETLVDSLNPTRSTSHTPLFQIMVNQNAGSKQGDTAELDEDLPIATKYDLTLNIAPFGKGFAINFEYNTDLFEADFIARMKAGFDQMLDAVLDGRCEKLSELPLLDTAARESLLKAGEGETARFELEQNLLELIDNVCAEHNGRIAVESGGESLSYAQLQSRVNRLSHTLAAKGVVKGQQVALLLSPGVDLIVALLAVLKSGAVYVPLTHQFPSQRIAQILTDGEIELALTDSRSSSWFDHPDIDGLELLMLDDDQTKEAIGLCSEQPLLSASQVAGTDLAYVIYTSGSTGKPKGVMISHTAVVNFGRAMTQRINVATGKRWLMQTVVSFDIAVFEWLGALLSGGTCVVAGQQVTDDAFLLRDFIAEQKIDVIQATPSRYKQLLTAGWQGNDGLTLLSGGEPLDAPLQSALWQCGEVLWNIYGPTEATVWSLVRQVTQCDVDNNVVPIGNGLANYNHLVLDRQGRLVPPGVQGELAIAGLGLASGYFKREELTRERFIERDFGLGKQRIYLTGDLVKTGGDCQFEFLGRTDAQVKLNGYRIELHEIENCLLELAPVKNAAAVLSAGQNDSNPMLVAFVQVDCEVEAEQAKIVKDAKARLSDVLPAYMQPKNLTAMVEFPLNTNGKTDKKRLAQMAQCVPEQQYVAAVSGNEQLMAEIWQKLLKKDKVGITDNFFQSGGDSLLMVELAAALMAEGIEVSIKQLMENQTIEGLLQAMADDSLQTDTGVVVKLNDCDTSAAPLFLVHPLSGTVFDFKPIAQQLGDCAQVYGIQAPYLAGQHFNYASIEQLAEFYLAEVRKTCPNGPYRFGGVSAGVQIAYQMAVLAAKQGFEVDLLVSLDSPPFNVFDQIKTHLDAVALCADLILDKAAFDGLLVDCQNLEADAQRQLLAQRIKDSGQARYFSGIEVSEYVDFVVDYGLAQSQPGSLAIAGKTVHFATEFNPHKQRILDTWQQAMHGKFDVVELKGSHDDIYSEDNLATFIAGLRRLFAGAQ